MTLSLASSAFQPRERIPKRHTGEGADFSPPLAWTGLPPGTKELALICDDPDAPRPKPWVHWVLYGLPPTLQELKEGHSGVGGPAPSGVEGPNDSGDIGWSGPMPPNGHGVHRYFFRLYALSAKLESSPGWTKERLLAEMEGRILETAELMGTYERK
jgi:Raf kinase inhibitor-like YbhB/YbcL family protein